MNDGPTGTRSPLPATNGSKRVKVLLLAGMLAVLLILPVFSGPSYLLHVLILTFIYIVAAVSFRTITISGQFSISHAGFMGLGAYASGMAAKWLGWPTWITVPLAGIVAMFIGSVVAYPFSRLRAMYYAMGSLFCGVALIDIIASGRSLTGGYAGLSGIPPLFISRISYYYFFLVIGLASVVALYRFEFSRIGVTLKAIAQSHVVASSVGINESRYRVLVVGVGCFFVGLIGACYGHYNRVLSPISFSLGTTLWIIMYALVGGIGSFAGPIIGTVILVLIPNFASQLKGYLPFVSAVILLIIAYLMPQGLVGLPQAIRNRRSRGRNRALSTGTQ